MFDVRCLTVCLILLKVVHAQQTVIGDPCTLNSTGASGICKLLSECQSIREQVVTTFLLPQACGFQGTQAIVCCPKSLEERKPGEISSQKCREYSSYAYNKSVSSEDSEITSNECGHSIVKRIVGGVKATRDEFPHMAIIGYESPGNVIKWLCGGSVISEQYVLTTASCLNANNAKSVPKYVKIGFSNLNDATQGQQLNVAERIPHPEYQFTSYYHDIGLIKLEKPIAINQFARPACLNFKPDISVGEAIATGWGVTESGSTSSDLLKVTLNLIDGDACNKIYKKFNVLKTGILYDRQLCTSTEKKDTCSGDSGGPLQIYHDGDDITCMYDIVGLVSFGPKLCANAPAVYTRISYYIKWIEDIVWPKTSLVIH